MKTNQSFHCRTLREEKPRFEELTSLINAEHDPAEKSRLGLELENEVTKLLQCGEEDPTQPECRHCRLIAGLRLQAAKLVQAAGRFSRNQTQARR